MDTLLNDIFHAQPDALLMIAGLVFIAVAVVGSIKTYIDPGKAGRIAAGVVGAILLIAGVVMYKPAPAGTPVAAVPSVAVAATLPAAPPASSSQAVASGQGSTSACFVPGSWPSDLHKPMAVGSSCTNFAGQQGKAVSVNPVCTYTSGPLTGTNQQFNHLMYVGYLCASPDHKSKGSVLPLTN
jgi:hypothetical protein